MQAQAFAISICIIVVIYLHFGVPQTYDSRGSTVEVEYLKAGLASNGLTPDKCYQYFGLTEYTFLKKFSFPNSFWGKIQISFSVNIKYKELMIWVAGVSSNMSSFAIVGPNGKYSSVAAQKMVNWTYYSTTTLVGDLMLQGFNDVWKPEIIAYFKEIYFKYCDFKLLWSGHSIGGCIAQMMALAVFKEDLWPFLQYKYFAYGTPRCGDQEYAANFDSIMPFRLRFNWYYDGVPDLPTNNCNKKASPQFGQTGTKCWFQSGHALVAWFKSGTQNDTTITYCQINDDPWCTWYGDTNKYYEHHHYQMLMDPAWYENMDCSSLV